MSGGNSSQAVTLPQPCQPEQGQVIIGRYRLIEKLGEGGFGEVWLGEQREPVRRRVAVKIIKLGMDTRQVVARFEAERQALALMDHPNIAKVLDGGATEGGRPYFVMEVVKGVPITEYCATQRCSTEERLRLFVQVCRAIQHAHQKGIIHRDIKPSNVLVAMSDGVPAAKVIDFGIAKATQQELTDKTLVTHLQQFIGTPAYMSPEQAEMTGLDIDTRSDIYSLGVLLYELLTGATPFDSRKLLSAGIEEMRRIIREEYPVPPSTRLATTVKERREKSGPDAERPEHLIGALRGDLDWIVMKCLEKDRTRRYETANGLGMDVERHLRHEPVAARPPSTVYRLRKTAARHRLAFASAAVVLLALVGAVVVSSWSALRARRAEQQQRALRTAAERSQQQAEAARALAQRHLYAADMLLAFQAESEGNLGQVRRLVQKYAGPEGAELRGWEWRRLARIAAGDPALVLGGHSDDVPFSSFIPGQNQVATMCMDGILRIFDAGTGAELERREMGRGRRGMAVSPDGRIMVTVADRLHVWTAGERREIEIEADFKVTKPSFSRDGKWFAYSNSRAVRVYAVPEFRLAKTIPRGEAPMGSFTLGTAFAADSQAIIYPTNDRRVVLHQISSGVEQTLGTAESEALSIAVSPDGQTIAAADLAGILICPIGDTNSILRLTEHREQVVSVAFSPDGTMLASASGDQTVRLWDTATWKSKRVLRGHEHEVHSVDFAADGRALVSSGKDHTARIWDLASAPPRDEARPVRWPSFVANNTATQKLLVQTDEGQLGTLDLADLSIHPFPGKWLEGAATSAAGGETIAAGFNPDRIEVWTGSPLARIWAFRTAEPLWQLALSDNGRWLAAGFNDYSFELWSLREGKRVLTIPGLPGSGSMVFNPVFAPGGKLLARVSAGRGAYNEITILDLETFATNGFPSTHNGAITSAALSPNGELLATGAFDGKLKLWKPRTGQELASFFGQLVGYTAVCFSKDGTRLAAGGWDGTITLWEMASFQQVGRWKAHRANCAWLQFMDGDAALASVGQMIVDGQWEVATWRGRQ